MSLLASTDSAVYVRNREGGSPVVLICEHASEFIPTSLAGLGLTEAAKTSHAAWDIGAKALAFHLSDLLDAPLVYGGVSRLVYDCNRPPGAPSAFPTKSEMIDVPGNSALSNLDKINRISEVYDPFHGEVSRVVRAQERIGSVGPIVVTVHSFTPIYFGETRAVEIGILHDSDVRLAYRMTDKLQVDGRFRTELNAPYDAKDGVTHSLQLHAIPNGYLNVMIEVRNDLLGGADGISRVAICLAKAIDRAVQDIEAEAIRLVDRKTEVSL
jgi:predicted N-formylglutamate amidohydrolase